MKVFKLILAAMLLFSAGAVAGGAASRIREKANARIQQQRRGNVPPPLWQRMEYLRRAQRDLDLTADQRQRIDTHVRESQEAVRRIWEPVAPRARAELETLRDRIRGELSADQRDRFDRALQEGRKGGRPGERGESGGRRPAKAAPEGPAP